MVNTKLLHDAMKRNGYTIEKLAKATGISRTGMFNKIHNISEFRLTEINDVAIALNLKNAEFKRIFFANDVESNSTN